MGAPRGKDFLFAPLRAGRQEWGALTWSFSPSASSRDMVAADNIGSTAALPRQLISTTVASTTCSGGWPARARGGNLVSELVR